MAGLTDAIADTGLSVLSCEAPAGKSEAVIVVRHPDFIHRIELDLTFQGKKCSCEARVIGKPQFHLEKEIRLSTIIGFADKLRKMIDEMVLQIRAKPDDKKRY